MNAATRTFCVILLTLLGVCAGFAAPTIKAEMDGEVFGVGDLVAVDVRVLDNPGLHGLFFDLNYDSSILRFEGIEKGFMALREVEENSFLYAHSDPATSTAIGSHVIVAYALRKAGAETRENGILARLYFRLTALGTANQPHQFTFNDTQVQDKIGAAVSVTWQDSVQFYASTPVTTGYINIASPHDHDVFYTGSVSVDATFTQDGAYSVRLSNPDSGYTAAPISAAPGFLSGAAVPIAYGFNRITAELLDGSGNRVAQDVATVYRSTNEKFVKIVSPADHALLNTDLVSVRVSSPFDTVRVNGLTAAPTGEMDGSSKIFSTRLWLTRGFNSIRSEAVSGEGAIYSDTINVYYQKSDSLFRIVTPPDGFIYKAGGGDQLTVKGELSGLYKSQGVPNTVTLRVIYKPRNRYLAERYLLKDVPARISETDLAAGEAQAPYMFVSDPISLDGLDTGEIEIVAYKNKVGATWENDVHRLVYVDNSRLEINLLQPNIYGHDVLDTAAKVKAFNDNQEPVWNDIQLEADGSFMLAPNQEVATEVTELSGKSIADLIELSNGDLLALANENGAMKVYRKPFGESAWTVQAVREDMYGYDLCETGLGVLVGVSNLYTNSNSGLYLLEGAELKNVRIGQPITHVQFIQYRNGLVYLYGNDYSNLYSFNLYSLEEQEGVLQTAAAHGVPFDNDVFIRQFILSPDAVTAVIRTSDGRVRFYQDLNGDQYLPVSFNPDVLNDNDAFDRVVPGEYTDGDYNVYLLVRGDNTTVTVMEEKGSRRLAANVLKDSAGNPTGSLGFEPGEQLLGVGFHDNAFRFLTRKSDVSNFTLYTAQVFFDMISREPGPASYFSAAPVNRGNLNLLETAHGVYYLGIGSELAAADRHLLQFWNVYPTFGNVAFNYKNVDVEGLSGFSFEVDPIWLARPGVQLGFILNALSGGIVTQVARMPLQSLLTQKNDYCTITHSYDAGIEKEVVNVTFNELQQARYLSFDLQLAPVGAVSPSLGNLMVQKKAPVQLPRNGGQTILLPIHGQILDPTVQTVYVNELSVALERDGSFSLNYPISTSKNEIPILISCENGARERAQLSFQVKLFDSLNGLSGVEVRSGTGELLAPDDAGQIHCTSNTLRLSGSYYGLAGAVVGYELYQYSYAGGREELVLLRSGVLARTVDSPINPAYSHLGPGYESGSFSGADIRLSPGRQRLVLYAENPGGLRAPYLVSGKAPDVMFDLPESQQRILISNLDVLTPPIMESYAVSGIIVDKEIDIDVKESAGSPYVYTREFLIQGEVQSLYAFQDLKVRSYSSSVVFQNGQTEIVVPVDSANRFRVPVRITMPEKTEAERFSLAFVPTAPFLDWMKTGLALKVSKSFLNTHIVPDFQPMGPEQWTSAEKVALRKPLRVKFNRFVPTGTHLTLLVNYETTISGLLQEVNPGEGIYKLMDGIYELDLSGVRFGTNRIRWELSRNGTIASSFSGRPDMEDYVLTLTGNPSFAPTTITFPIQMQTYYNASTGEADSLPMLAISKDTTTWAKAVLNGATFWEDDSGTGLPAGNLKTGAIREGRNYLTVSYREKSGEAKDVEYNFLYDTLSPAVTITSYAYTSDYSRLRELTAVVHEANLMKTDLLYGASDISRAPTVSYLGDDNYQVTWSRLDTYTYSIIPSSGEPVRVRIQDYSGKTIDSPSFTGVASVDRPEGAESVDVPMSEYQSGVPYILEEEAEGRSRERFYNDEISVRNKTITGTYRIERPVVSLGNVVDGQSGVVVGDAQAGNGDLHVNATDRISLKPGFTVKAGSTFTATITPGSPAIPKANPLVFTHEVAGGGASQEVSFVTWFRYDREPYYAPDTAYRRILTVFDNGVVALYLAYKDDTSDVPNDAKLYVVKETLATGQIEVIIGSEPFSDTGLDDWNIINLGFSNTSGGAVFLTVNNQTPRSRNWTIGAPLTAMFNDGAQYHYGDTNTARNGEFSIAGPPFYVNQVLTTEEALVEAHRPSESVQESQRFYEFPTAQKQVGGEFQQLRAAGTDWFSANEDVLYQEAEGTAVRGSLKASALHLNLLSREVAFGEETATTSNLRVTPEAESIVLEPINTTYPGKYLFGNTFGNHQLRYNRYYSVSGTVHSARAGTAVDARMVLRIDNREQSMTLREGEFHFVYDNTATGAPDSVILFIETSSALRVSRDIVFTEGNYLLPPEGVEGIPASYASTKYLFQSQGTIDFYYKPLVANREGFVSYPVMLLDSEYITIGAHVQSGSPYATFYATIRDSLHTEDPVSSLTLSSDTPVREGWQHIQLSYCMGTTTSNDVVYLYINGKIAAKSEGVQVPPAASSLPVAGHDNLVIGADRLAVKATYADGYIDGLKLSNLYDEAVATAPDPVQFSYTDALPPSIPELTIQAAGSASDITYILESRDGSFRQVHEGVGTVAGHGFDMAALVPGPYLLKSRMTINGHRYSGTFHFTKNSTPRFLLKAVTPLIIRGVESEIHFSLDYENSYLQVNEAFQFAGLAVQIQGRAGESQADNFTHTLYIVQDYRTPDRQKWVISQTGRTGVVTDWSAFPVNGKAIEAVFAGVRSTIPISWEVRPFYCTGLTDLVFGSLPAGKSGSIEDAYINADVESFKGIEYKVKVKVGSDQGDISGSIVDQLTIGYHITSTDSQYSGKAEGIADLNSSGGAELYYDEMFGSATGLPEYGSYSCILSLRYQGQTYSQKTLTLQRKETVSEESISKETSLELLGLSLLYLDKRADTTQLYLEYKASGPLNDLRYDITVTSNKGEVVNRIQPDPEHPDLLSPLTTFRIFNGVAVPEGNSYIKIHVYSTECGLSLTSDLEVANLAAAPEVVLTNSVPSLIAYNNVRFSWRGYHNGAANTQIQYSYALDDRGWTVPNADWKQVEFYGLAEGTHRFRVKAIYGGVESPVESVTFFVDIHRPVFDAGKIGIAEFWDDDGVLYAVTVTGAAGAITDASLQALALNGTSLDVSADGQFTATKVPLGVDGANKLIFTAYDRVGNFTDHTLTIANTITEITYPVGRVRYAPAVLVGRLSPKVSGGAAIYLADPGTENRGDGDFSGWKRATINADRTFFVEDVFVNPGTAALEAHTPLTLATRTASGKIFYKSIDLWANEVLRPIDMELSTHAVEGQGIATTVDIHCAARVENISSWAIDFEGDGVYDQVDMVDNPASGTTQSWQHSYSSLGLVKPRVRLITRDGAFFSVSDEIIIHEQITEASNAMIDAPIAMTVVPMPDASSRVFVLAGTGNMYRIEVYEIGRNETYISNRLFTISLNGMGIEGPVDIEAGDAEHLYIAANRGGVGRIYTLATNQFGNYVPVPQAETLLSAPVRTMDRETGALYVSFTDSSNLAELPIRNMLPVPGELRYALPAVPNAVGLGTPLSLAKDPLGILVADTANQRILRLSDSFTVLETHGAFGEGEGQFLRPGRVESLQNRVFIYDETRKDIQVFDPLFKPITRLAYDAARGSQNYLAADFLQNLADIGVVTKEDGSRLYYYALLLSRSSGKLSMLRLPQWEEMRARVRNNAVVFLKDKEVYTAKPDGADLKKVLSSDSIPRIEGTLDYPALSPDGRTLVFTSRVRLYDGAIDNTPSGNGYAYDNLYMMDVGGGQLARIPMDGITNYEIERPEFSSNGDRLIFSAKPTGGRWQLYVYTFATGGLQRLFESEENARFPYYSPDDRFVVFTTDYDGDEEIEIFDTQNPTVRVSVTSNICRDSLPVWNAVYPYEISNPDLKIDSKIGFVSERGYHKGVYYAYVARPSEGDVRVVTKAGANVGDSPDSAAIELTTALSEGDYPTFTGDGRSVVYGYFDGSQQYLNRYAYETSTVSRMNLPAGSSKPAGMKNTIANFRAEVVDGNAVRLNWTPYTDTDIFYTVRFKANKENEPFVQKKVFSQDSTTLTGLEMGQEYLFKVCIMENGEEAATTLWKRVLMPKVAARPTVQVDAQNPYLVRLSAWKPDDEKIQWLYTWIIDNQNFDVQTSQQFVYEFATSGRKTIVLKAADINNKNTTFSQPVSVDIRSDIVPDIRYTLADDGSYITLDASGSKGARIDWATSAWVVSGPGHSPMPPVTGSQAIVALDGFRHKINVNFTIRRVPVNGQSATDTLERNIVVDLDYKEVKPVITYTVDDVSSRLLTFSGNSSLGNIDWYRAQWCIYKDGATLHQASGVSSLAFEFPETSSGQGYTVALTVPHRNDSGTETASIVVDVSPAPIEPVIDYEILTLKEGTNVVGAKILFSCSGSKGSNIDFTSARWSVPVAGSYGEQPTQVGPTAVYNLFGVDSNAQVEVSLTLTKRGGTDAVSVTRTINVKPGEEVKTRLRVNAQTEETTIGTTVILDVLSSTGPNINWEQTSWLIDGQYARTGPVARVDVPASGANATVRYVCTLYRYGAAPLTESKEILVKRRTVEPVISCEQVPGDNKNVYELWVTDTAGTNIDWERTNWYIYDGHESVVKKQGANITHAFALKEQAMGYPVMVEMFLKNDTVPFVGYTSIDVEGDELRPMITYDKEASADAGTITFSAESSLGKGIDWSQVKWTFGDSSEAQYGTVAVHKFPLSTTRKSYNVSLTLVRRSSTGSTDSVTAYKNVDIDSDAIKPVIKATLYGQYLVLSAEESVGRGLLLDRSLWVFEGQGDSESLSVNMKTGTIETSGSNSERSATAGFGSTNLGGFFCQGTASAGDSSSTTKYDDLKDNTESFSSQNDHTGAIARRYIGTYDISTSTRDQRQTILVTLYVYRANSDGGIDGRSITVNVDLAEAAKGARYE